MKLRQICIIILFFVGILLVIISLRFVEGKRSKVEKTPAGLQISLTFESFEIPLVLPLKEPATPSASAEAIKIIELGNHFLNATTWRQVLALHTNSSRQSIASSAEKHWEQAYAKNPTGRHTTIFSCVVVKAPQGRFAWTHFMGAAFIGPMTDLPQFPFLSVKCYRWDQQHGWLYDQTMNGMPLSKALLSISPLKLEDNLIEIKEATASSFGTSAADITITRANRVSKLPGR